jgi:DHA2 family multidrug resistance protein
MLRGTDSSTASRRALGALYGIVQQQAAMLSFVEAFKIMGVVFLAMIPMVFLLKDPKHNNVAKDAPKPQATTQTADEAPIELVPV